MDNGDRFVRVLGQRDVIALAFGAMIGFGWVPLVGTWLTEAGSLGAILAFLIGGTVVVFVGLTYSELVSAMPKAGGEHNYAWRTLGPVGAFVASWAIALGYVSVTAFEAVALPTTMEFLLPEGFKAGFLWTIAGYDVYATWVAIGVVGAAAITVLNYIGVKPSAIFQFIAVLALLGIAALFIFGTFIGGSGEDFTPLFSGAGIASHDPFLFCFGERVAERCLYRFGLRVLYAVIGCAVAAHLMASKLDRLDFQSSRLQARESRAVIGFG